MKQALDHASVAIKNVSGQLELGNTLQPHLHSWYYWGNCGVDQPKPMCCKPGSNVGTSGDLITPTCLVYRDGSQSQLSSACTSITLVLKHKQLGFATHQLHLEPIKVDLGQVQETLPLRHIIITSTADLFHPQGVPDRTKHLLDPLLEGSPVFQPRAWKSQDIPCFCKNNIRHKID